MDLLLSHIVVFTSESHDTESCNYAEFIVINKGQEVVFHGIICDYVAWHYPLMVCEKYGVSSVRRSSTRHVIKYNYVRRKTTLFSFTNVNIDADISILRLFV